MNQKSHPLSIRDDRPMKIGRVARLAVTKSWRSAAAIVRAVDGTLFPSFQGFVWRHLELVCDTVAQQYDNLYGFGSLQRPFGSAALSFTFRGIQWHLLLSFSLFLSLSCYFSSSFSPFDLPSRFHAADRSAGHQRGFIPHSETAVISRGWIGNPLSLPHPSAHLPPA